jgi:transposase
MMVDTDRPVIGTVGGTEADTSTRTSDRRSARPQRIEVITRGERRRRWSLEEKQVIVAESLAPNASLTAVARRHEIGTGLLYAWRQPSGLIEIVLLGGISVRVDAQVDDRALRRVLAALRG